VDIGQDPLQSEFGNQQNDSNDSLSRSSQYSNPSNPNPPTTPTKAPAGVQMISDPLLDPLSNNSAPATPFSTPSRSSTAPSVSQTPATPQGSNSNESKTKKYYSQYFRRYELLIEFKNLSNPEHCPSGVYVMPSMDDFYQWLGVMFLHSCGTTHFGERPAVLKFCLEIPPDYPEKAPEVRILSNVVHPLIHPQTRKLELRQQFAEWKPQKHHICHVLHYLKNAFSSITLENLQPNYIADEKAYETFRINPNLFGEQARNWAYESHGDLSNSHGNMAFSLTPIDSEKYKEATKSIFKDHKPSFPIEEESGSSFGGLAMLKKGFDVVSGFVSSQS